MGTLRFVETEHYKEVQRKRGGRSVLGFSPLNQIHAIYKAEVDTPPTGWYKRKQMRNTDESECENGDAAQDVDMSHTW